MPSAGTPSRRLTSVFGKGGLALWTGVMVTAVVVAQMSPADAQVVSFNPVAPASGFLVVTEGNARFAADESEGPAAVGGNLSFGQYQILIGPAQTPIAPGDTTPIGLLVRGTVDFNASANRLQVSSNAFVKIGNTTGIDVRDRDPNNAPANTRILPAGALWDSTPVIQLNGQQPATSVTTPVPLQTFNFDAAFAQFRASSAALVPCANNVQLLDTQNQPIPNNAPPNPNTPVRVNLTAGAQNVLNLTATSLANISEITYLSQPNATTPLVVNVATTDVGNNFTWVPPNTPGISGAQAPYILWNFPTLRTLTVPPTGGATIEGTVFAPNANFSYQGNNNIEGNVIAASFAHVTAQGSPGQVREIHYFPFDARLTPCVEPPPPTTTLPSTTTSASTTSTTLPSTTSTTTLPPTTSTRPPAPPTTGANGGGGGPGGSGGGSSNGTLPATGTEHLARQSAVASVLLGLGLLAMGAARRRREQDGGTAEHPGSFPG